MNYDRIHPLFAVQPIKIILYSVLGLIVCLLFLVSYFNFRSRVPLRISRQQGPRLAPEDQVVLIASDGTVYLPPGVQPAYESQPRRYEYLLKKTYLITFHTINL